MLPKVVCIDAQQRMGTHTHIRVWAIADLDRLFYISRFLVSALSVRSVHLHPVRINPRTTNNVGVFQTRRNSYTLSGLSPGL